MLAREGYDVEVWRPGRTFMVRQRDSDGAVLDAMPPDCDVLVLQRVQSRMAAKAIPHLQRRGIRVVVDVDDDFSCIDPANTAWTDIDPKRNPNRNWHWTRTACAAADLVTVTTPALADRYGRHGRVRVLPNRLPRFSFATAAPHDDLRVGWAGYVGTHPNDLQVMRGSVGQLLDERAMPFHVVGPAEGVAERVGVRQVKATGLVSFDRWPRAIAALDIGVVPLADTAFNAGKSFLKGLEMAAAGVIPVMSPTPEYLRLHADGIGLLAKRPRDWRSAAAMLLDNEDRRLELAARSLAGARRHVMEDHLDAWADAWAATATTRATV
jgi:hypothetical protein